MATILISIAAKIAEYPVIPILRQIGYLTNFNKNLKNLNRQAEKLKHLKLEVDKAIEHAKRNAEIIEPQVERWLAKVLEIIEEVEKIEDESKIKMNCFPSGKRLNCIYRYRISRKSSKKVIAITELLQEKGLFRRISHPTPLPGIEYLSSKDFILFESTKSAMDQIRAALGKDEINVVFLHGTRGVGKTVLAKQMGKEAKDQKMFDEVVMASVSKTPDWKDIQGQLADMLGLKIKEESDLGRARRLCLRLKHEKKILIILDDVWGKPDLEAIGIPSAMDHKGCKILITTQNENIGRTMGAGTMKVALNALSEDESWRLFKSIKGDIVDNPAFNVVAKDIVGKCEGIPLNLKTIGKKLGNKRIEVWRDVNRQIGDLEANLLDDYF